MKSVFEVSRLGTVPYLSALELQQELVKERQCDHINDQLLLLEHPHVITTGSNSRRTGPNVLASLDELNRIGVSVLDAPRGGNVTYHGPGQLVVYPIFDLKPDRCDIHRYVRDIEEVLIRTAAFFGVVTSRVKGLTGVWVGRKKLAAIGIRISKWVTSHGFALNLTTDLEYFNLIHPCGINDRGVTSLVELLGKKINQKDVEDIIIQQFSEVFERQVLANTN